MSKQTSFVKKPLFYGGIAYIVLFFVAMISGSLSFFLPEISAYLVPVVYLVCYVLAFNAFFVLGKVYKSNLLKVLSIIAIVFSVLFFLGSLGSSFIFSDYFSNLNNTISNLSNNLNSLNSSNYTEQQVEDLSAQYLSHIITGLLPVIIVFGVFALIFFVYVILFGVSLIKLGEKVKYAKVAGILNIVGICTIIFFVGIFVLIAASIFEIMVLFNEAKKFKEIK